MLVSGIRPSSALGGNLIKYRGWRPSGAAVSVPLLPRNPRFSSGGLSAGPRRSGLSSGLSAALLVRRGECPTIEALARDYCAIFLVNLSLSGQTYLGGGKSRNKLPQRRVMELKWWPLPRCAQIRHGVRRECESILEMESLPLALDYSHPIPNLNFMFLCSEIIARYFS